ncbi:hypothetical protein K1719_012154 [Acacia pycnantha]|nr:hypothetical protein K1719_012154 [Acacia pycnantha]
MACSGEGILTDLIRRLVDKTIKEVNYFRHFETHDHGFTQELRRLIGNLDKVQKDIDYAKTNNQNQILDGVQQWIDEARNLVLNKTEIKQTRFDSWCPLIRQYRQGKRLAQRTEAIKDLNIGGHFEVVAHPAELLDKEYHASRDFIDFESRKTKFKELVEALADGNHYMIGLQGMGGTGKTTLATQVSLQVEESKAFDKVIFVVVSNLPDVNKIRGDIARQLGLRLEESEEADRSKSLWSSIYKNEKKLLIILDDVWEELNLKEIGIPSGPDHKSCYVLITTRHSKVCRDMRCQQIVQLHKLHDDDALRLFLFHVTSDSSRNELEGLAREFLKECGGLPVAIVALASTLRSWHVGELNAALTALQNSKPFVDVDEGLVEVYNCLRLSYDYLHNEKAQKLFLLCSIFPEDYEFPVNLVIRLGIGAGIFEEANDYCVARIQALAVRKKLIDSSLLQKVGEKECVKMHDLVREVAQWIANEYIQVIKDSRTTLRTNKRFVFWSIEDFPDQFDDTNLEILLVRISGNVQVKDPYSFFARMSRLKILFLLGECDRRVPSPSLPKSLLSLKDIHTLILDGWELGDISILKNIQSLVTLEFKNCLIMELPRNIMELKKLRWLGLRKCEIQRKNPFAVIKRCLQVEELYFVENYNVKDWNTEDDKEIEDEIAQDISLAELQIFSIAYDGFERFAGDDNGLLRCFNAKHIKHLISDAMFKYLVRSAEILQLGKLGQTKVKLLFVPSFISIFENCVLMQPQVSKEDSKEKHENSKASAFSWAHGCCFLAVTKHTNIRVPNAMMEHHTISQKPTTVVQINYRKINLPQLSKLTIAYCEELVNVVEDDSHEHHHMNYSSIFPKLEDLSIQDCNKLEFIFPLSLSGGLQKLKSIIIIEVHELKYVFGKYNEEECLSNENESNEPHFHLPTLETLILCDVPNMISIGVNKYQQKCPSIQNVEAPEAPTKDTNIGVPNATVKHHTISISQGSCGSSKMMETVHTAECLVRYPLSLQNIREMTLTECSKLKSLFSVSIATTMIMLEKLKIEECEELKDIITNETEDDDHLNCTSIFPKLQSLDVEDCNKLEFIFPSTLSGGSSRVQQKIFSTFDGFFTRTKIECDSSRGLDENYQGCAKVDKAWNKRLQNRRASELEQVFVHKQDDMHKMTMMDEVFPELSYVSLRKLPRLVTICEGIDFQTLEDCEVYDCPKYQGNNHNQEGLEDEDSENQAATNASPDFAESSKEAMTTSVEEVASSFSKKEIVKEIEAKDPTAALLEKQALEASTTKPHLRSTSLHNYKETEKEGGRVVPDPASKLPAPTSSSFQSIDVTLQERSEQSPTLEDAAVSDLKSRNSSAYKETEEEVGKAIPASNLLATTSPDFEVIFGQPRTKQNLVASMKEKHEQGSEGDGATRKVAIAIQSTDSESMKRTRVSSIIAQSLEETEKEAATRQASQLPISPTSTNLKVTQGIKDTMEEGPKENYPEDDAMILVRSTNSNSMKQSTIGPIDNLTRNDSTMTIEEAADHLSVQKEAKSEKPTKSILPQVIPSLHYQLQYTDASSSSPKLGICEIFRLVELKHGETALLAQALEQYPQLLLPRANRTHRIITWSYRVLVDILVMLDTKTPNTITQSEKSTLEANLSEAIVLGFDKNWVEFIRAKVFGVDMSDVSTAKEEIQAMEAKLGEIESQLLGLSEYRKKLIESTTMFRDIVRAKDKPFGI